MIRAIAIDDEPAALDVISFHACRVPFIQLERKLTSTAGALEFLRNHPVDLVFLDIRMPDMSGLEFAKLVKPGTHIVLTTAYADYALAGFDLAVTDFLLKPISLNRFIQACELVRTRMNGENDDSFYLRDGSGLVRIEPGTLVYAKAEDNYVHLFTNDRRLLIRTTLSDLAARLSARDFLRVHKSWLVNRRFIDQMEGDCLTVAGVRIPVSHAYRKEIRTRLAGG